ncbi:MAG: Lrp/AsnC family transcriptional regulator [Deltaproteobacteria bacterium]
MPYDEIDKRILKFVQADIPLVSRPYQELAQELGISEAEAVSRIEYLREKGIIRRVGAILRHQKAGFGVNAMTAWRVEYARADEIGGILASFDQVSHCYLRQVPPEFGFNIFAMVHARNEEELFGLVRDMSNHTGVDDYSVFRSIKEYKKVSMEYF